MTQQKTGVEMIAAERQRQIDVEGYTAEHDIEHNDDLAKAAAMYALPDRSRRDIATPSGIPYMWPWAQQYWKPTPDDRVRELVKAGALIAAEIDRLTAEVSR